MLARRPHDDMAKLFRPRRLFRLNRTCRRRRIFSCRAAPADGPCAPACCQRIQRRWGEGMKTKGLAVVVLGASLSLAVDMLTCSAGMGQAPALPAGTLPGGIAPL